MMVYPEYVDGSLSACVSMGKCGGEGLQSVSGAK